VEKTFRRNPTFLVQKLDYRAGTSAFSLQQREKHDDDDDDRDNDATIVSIFDIVMFTTPEHF
jgi:hypothetical protein